MGKTSVCVPPRALVKAAEDMTTTDDGSVEAIIATLLAHAAELRAAGIRHLSMFGSTARGEAGSDSDVDLLAELDPEAHIGLIRLAGIELRLGKILGRRVDLLPEPIQRARLRANVERDRRR